MSTFFQKLATQLATALNHWAQDPPNAQQETCQVHNAKLRAAGAIALPNTKRTKTRKPWL